MSNIHLCLSGGGSMGILQAGMIKAWHELGLTYDVLHGTSVGSLNGLFLHQNRIDEMLDLWMNIKNPDVYSLNPFGNFLSGKFCLYDSSPLERTLKKYIDNGKVAGNPKKFLINVTNFTDWSGVTKDVHELGEDLPAFLRASASPPVLFEPVSLNGQQYLDGGLSNNFSVSQAVEMGADVVVLFQPQVPETCYKINSILDVMQAGLSLPSYISISKELKFVETINSIVSTNSRFREVKVIVVKAESNIQRNLIDFNYKKDRKSLINHGYELAYETLRGSF
jgi:NTE family protein